jgi:hypothetical protein
VIVIVTGVAEQVERSAAAAAMVEAIFETATRTLGFERIVEHKRRSNGRNLSHQIIGKEKAPRLPHHHLQQQQQQQMPTNLLCPAKGKIPVEPTMARAAAAAVATKTTRFPTR